MQTMTAANANRHFSSLLRDVHAGQTIQITSRGKPVAIVEPIAAYDASASHDGAQNAAQAVHTALFARLHAQRQANSQSAESRTRNWIRDELYD